MLTHGMAQAETSTQKPYKDGRNSALVVTEANQPGPVFTTDEGN